MYVQQHQGNGDQYSDDCRDEQLSANEAADNAVELREQHERRMPTLARD